MKERNPLDRRSFLRYSAGVPAGLIAAPTAVSWLTGPQAAAASASSSASGGFPPFVDDYLTNTTENLSAETNAAVRVLSGMEQLWKTGASWDSGAVLDPAALRANMRYSVRITAKRTDEQARQSFIYDRQHQSYSAIGGLGPLADIYKSGALAVTGITTAPDGTPPTKVSDALPDDAPEGAALGAGSVTSELGKVAELVNTVRGPHASSNPSKYTYQYPRPWRMTDASEVVDTGETDDLGYPVYDSNVIVAPQLLRQRSTTPDTDGGYPSGHTNAVYLATLALAYAVPERFQELVTRAADVSDSRIVSGMHSAVDVIGGRVLGTALAAAALADPQYAELKAAARRQAAEYFQTQTGSTADTLYEYAHSAGPDTDPYADREANERLVTPRLTYVLPCRGRRHAPMTVPKGAEVLLETRLPYLSAAQRREVLRTTALPSGYALLDGDERWGRLNLFAAADGYGSFARDVRVDMNARDRGFNAADTWRNDISGRGGLIKRGSGALALTGANRYRGGTRLEAGTLTAGSADALGRGDVQVRGGVLRLAPAAGAARVRGDYVQSSGGTLEVTLRGGGRPALTVGRSAVLRRGSALEIHLDADQLPATDRPVPVLRARWLRGRFRTVTVHAEGYRAVPVYTAHGLSVRLIAE